MSSRAARATALALLAPLVTHALQTLQFGDLNKTGTPVEGSCSELKNHGPYFTVYVSVTGAAEELGHASSELEKKHSGKRARTEDKLALVVDTGSDELVVPSCTCKICQTYQGRCLQQKIPKAAKKVMLSYGSGDVEAAVMTGDVRVGSVTAEMTDSLLVMYDNDLDFSGNFEGILALGPPHRKGDNRMVRTLRSPDDDEDDDDGYFYTKSFLELAGVSRFSLCFNPGSDGILRLGAAASSDALGSIGGFHWGLGLDGVSTGSASSKTMVTCAPGSRDAGTHNPCGAIPDSGTTFILAPYEQLEELYDGLCQDWPACIKAAKKSDWSMAEVFIDEVETCKNLDSLPPINFHLSGAGGSKKTISIPGSAYIYKTKGSCQPALDVMEYSTEQNGPVWVLGLPIFFTHTVGYDVGAKPPTMTFDEGACTSCSGSMLRNSDAQWEVHGSPRRPNFDVKQPL